MKLRKILAAVAASAVATAAMATVASAADYNAYIAFQTTNWSFRNEWTDASYGKSTDYFDNYIVWGDANTDPDTYPGYEDTFDYDIAGYVLPATYVDAAITGDGTYTVEAKDIAWDIRGDKTFNSVTVTTDIPFEGGATITDVKLYVDGVETLAYDAAVVEGINNNEYTKINVVNIWNTDCTSYDGAYPTESLKVEFTVSGLGGDDTASAGDVDASADASADESKGSADTGIEDVAVIAGLGLLAGAGIVFTRKRK